MPRASVTRKVHFNAAHRVHNPKFSDQWNREMFGECSNPNYHGHNYELELTVEGEISPDTGYVMDLNHLKKLAQERLLRHPGPGAASGPLRGQDSRGAGCRRRGPPPRGAAQDAGASRVLAPLPDPGLLADGRGRRGRRGVRGEAPEHDHGARH